MKTEFVTVKNQFAPFAIEVVFESELEALEFASSLIGSEVDESVCDALSDVGHSIEERLQKTSRFGGKIQKLH